MLAIHDHDHVQEIHLQRPPANALNLPLLTALRETVTRLAAQSDTRALVISSRSGMFCGGLDVPALIDLDRAGVTQLWQELFAMMHALVAAPVPIVAAVTGHATAGGCVIASCCDYRIMANESRFKIGVNEVAVGIAMPEYIYRVLRYLIGNHEAERLCVTAALISPQEAMDIGLVDRLAPTDQVVEEALAFARQLAALPRKALERTRNMARASLVADAAIPDAETISNVVDRWFEAESQATLRTLVERLNSRR